jgi:hypothetical protein
MDGFFVSKFKVEKRTKVQKDGSQDVPSGDVTITLQDDEPEETPRFDPEEDKEYIEGKLSLFPSYRLSAWTDLSIRLFYRIEAKKDEGERPARSSSFKSAYGYRRSSRVGCSIIEQPGPSFTSFSHLWLLAPWYTGMAL